VPESGENRINGMIENRPRLGGVAPARLGVPIAVFVRKGTNEILKEIGVNDAIAQGLRALKAPDAWYATDGARFSRPGGY
jgi:isoleucyl-tRNA synthetase